MIPWISALVNSLPQCPFQADEPIADYAAMDDVMQGERGGEGLSLGWWPRIWVGKVENGDCDTSLSPTVASSE